MKLHEHIISSRYTFLNSSNEIIFQISQNISHLLQYYKSTWILKVFICLTYVIKNK